MKRIELKVARIGNSRGVRLPAATLARYEVGDTLAMEERAEGILLLPRGEAPEKLSWEETARAMAAAAEDWSAWNAADADGLETAVSWQSEGKPSVAEATAGFKNLPAGKRRK
jgi:antitoxin component of MazEF toxin-antitoxin module